MKNFTFVFICLIFSIKTTKSQHTFLNLDFEHYKSNTEPFQWKFNRASNDFLYVSDTTVSYSGRASLKVQKTTSKLNSTYVIYNYLDSAFIKRHKTLTLKCYVRYHNMAATPKPRLFLNQQSSKSKYQSSEELYPIDNNSVSEWLQISLSAKIDSSAERIIFGIASGSETIWYDRFEIYLDGKAIVENEMEPYPSQSKFEWLNGFVSSVDTTKGEYLKSIKGKLKDVAVIGLGESTHGTHEFFKARTQIIKDLIKHQNFNVIAFETPMAEAHELNEYILHNKGNVEELINNKYLFSINNTLEIKELLEWIKNENKTRNNKIYFAGVDMQSYHQALKNVVEGLIGIPELKVKVEDLKVNFQAKKSEINYKQINDQLGELHFLLKEKSKEYSKKIDDYNWILHNVELLKQTVSLNINNKGFANRDSLMARNLLFLKEYYPKSKIVFWAHNGHIDKYNYSTGKYLSNLIGHKYYAIGFTTRQGTVRIFRPGKSRSEIASVKKLYEGFLEFHLSQLSIQPFLLNLTKIDGIESLERKTLLDSLGFGSRGAASQQFYEEYVVLKRFDSLIFFNSSSPTIRIK